MTDPRFILKPVAYLWAWRLAVAIYAVSFLLPFDWFVPWFDFGGSGAVVFWWGLQMCYHRECFHWWANPLFWAALGLSWQETPWTACTLALLAFLVSGGFFFLVKGVPGPAYWAWTGSMGVLALGRGISLARHGIPDTRPAEDESEYRPPMSSSLPGVPHIQRPPR